MHPRALPTLAVLGAVALVPGVADAAKKKPKPKTPDRPLAGTYKLAGPHASSGSLTVTKRGAKVTKLRITPSAGAPKACGREQLSIKGSAVVRKVKRGSFTSWVVGTRAPRQKDGIAGAKVRALKGRTPASGRLQIVFGSNRSGSGTLRLGNCETFFTATRG